LQIASKADQAWARKDKQHSRKIESKTGPIASQTEMSRFKIYSPSQRLTVCALSAVFLGAAIADESESRTAGDCQIGAYRFSDGEIVDIARSEGDTFR
jgi:hypothetical protein